MEPKVHVPRSANDYKTFVFSFDTKQIHHIDQIDLRKQAREMIYTSLTTYAMATSKLQASLNNIHSQLKIENTSSLAKDTKIEGLEDLVLNLGLNHKDVK